MSEDLKTKDWLAKYQKFKAQQRQYYPSYHLASALGWMNDPNGLIYYNGVYHAFYQHYPYKAEWGPMHWGHATSKDMIHWQQHTPALWPTEDSADDGGCFSGSAVQDENGNLCLIYTGHSWLGDADEQGYRPYKQEQCLAISSDGQNFVKQGVVLSPPKGIVDFRDPKVWFADGCWWMVIGVSDQNKHGQVYLYKGESLTDWRFERVLAQSEGRLGYMWECPDFFQLNGKHILTFSPQGIHQTRGYKHRNLFDCGYLVGTWHPDQEFNIEMPYQQLDYGHDYYAAQTFKAKDGRRIVMAWMDMWESTGASVKEGWVGSMTLPRELSLSKDNKLIICPIAELKALRSQQQDIEAITLNNKTIQLSEQIEANEVYLCWDKMQATAERYGIRLGSGLKIYIDTQSERLILDRFYPEVNLSGARSIALPKGEELKLQIYFDNSSVEVFVNDGDAVLTSRIYPAHNDREVYIFADGGRAYLLEGKQWELKIKK